MSSKEAYWAPSCDPETLRARAKLLGEIRKFFAERGVLEVETPLLGRYTVTDPHLSPFETRFGSADGKVGTETLFLQTSPEFAMKRMLASGSGSIFQICKAFRNEEVGRWHNPEFTLLEWYRVGFGLTELMDEVDALLAKLFGASVTLAESERLSYRSVFRQHVGVDPSDANWPDFDQCARRLGFPEASSLCGTSLATWLDFLFSHAVQPHLGRGRISFVHDFPSCLPSLARYKEGNPGAVERAEVFLHGTELANGFHELTDANEQERRFDADIASLRDRGSCIREKDPRLLAALRAGLPDCAGIALGIDRLLMLLTGATEIAEVLAFPFAEA